MACLLTVADAEFTADPSGALYWAAEGTLIVADLHLEKGSGYAARGQFLPPYDTRASLDRLEAAIGRHRPRRVVALGDSVHDAGAEDRIDPGEARRIAALTAACDWIWVAGNHDPDPPAAWGGRVAPVIEIGGVGFRHEADPTAADGEVSGHFHPKASVRTRARRLTARCFVADARRLVLPAFGAYAGGLDVRDPAISGLFPKGFQAYLLGARGVHAYPHTALD